MAEPEQQSRHFWRIAFNGQRFWFIAIAPIARFLWSCWKEFEIVPVQNGAVPDGQRIAASVSQKVPLKLFALGLGQRGYQPVELSVDN